jgi:DNA-binding MurR/RpiR family transcriptional regulator
LGRALPVLNAADRIVVFGIGPSAALARYAAVLLARVGRRSMCLDGTGIMLADQMLDLRAGDAVLALAYSRPYREVTGLFGEARRLRLPIVLVSETAQSALAKSMDVVLVIPRGRRQRVALHGGTLVGLEVIVLALAAVDGECVP